LTLFAKGNVDVHDTLHSCRIGGELLWNGINDVLRITHPGCTARIKHETWTRSDALLRSDGTVPAGLASRDLPMGAYSPTIQFSHSIFETRADAIILSIQPDIMTSLVEHRREGFLLYPSEAAGWSEGDRAWLKSEFAPIEPLSVGQSMANFATIIEKVRERSEAPILVFNLSPITPGEEIHSHLGFGELYSTRIRAFNLGLIELSAETGISIIDIDSVVARKGADALKLDTLHLTPAGYRLVAGEVVRVLADLGILEK
jgi:hypothetical protein